MNGPLLRFNCNARVAVTGAAIALTLDGEAVPMNTPLSIAAGATLAIGHISGAGARSYLCLQGGVQVPDYLGSKAPSPSVSLAATADARCAPVTYCTWRRWTRT